MYFTSFLVICCSDLTKVAGKSKVIDRNNDGSVHSISIFFLVICGGDLTEVAGEIKAIDRNNDGKYDNRLDCIWTIHVGPHQLVQLQFISVQLEDVVDDWCYDYLEVS